MDEPAYVKVFDRLHRVGLGGDPDYRYRVAMRLAKTNYDDSDPAFERLNDAQFRAYALPIVEEVTRERTFIERRSDP